MKWMLLLVLASMSACSHGKTADEPLSEPSFIRGDVIKSGSRKASEERPQPWDEEKRRFPEDGLNLEGYAEKARSEHAEAHGKQDLRMESFSHPACAALPLRDRRTCPLLRLSWSNFKEVPGGASITVGAEESATRWLRWMVLCHVAFGKASGHKAGCPLHLPGVKARVTWKKKQAVLELVARDEDHVETLRDRLEHLVP